MKHLFQITEKKKQNENQQLFDGIIDVALFDGVEGIDYGQTNIFSFLGLRKLTSTIPYFATLATRKREHQNKYPSNE